MMSQFQCLFVYQNKILYPAIFSGIATCLTNVKLALTLESTVEPAATQLSSVPIHYFTVRPHSQVIFEETKNAINEYIQLHHLNK